MDRIDRRHLPLLMLALVALAGLAGCNKLSARDKLNKGVQNFKGGRYDVAIEYFKQAKELDPNLMNARLYLATAYATQYIPGAPSDENIRNGTQAVTEFREVLSKDAENLSAIDGIGSILYNMGGTPFDSNKFEESRTFHQKHIQIKPTDPEPYYWVGLINWTLSFRANGKMRMEYNATARKPIKDIDPLPEKLRVQYAQEYAAVVDEGIKALDQAIKLRPDYDDAFAYLNLLYRQKADQDATPQEREDHLAKADSLVEQFKVIKQRKMAAPAIPASQ